MKAWLAAFPTAAAVLWKFPPDRYGFYPNCPVFEASGLQCPGCGATRAAAALLHGHLVEALHWNALFVAAVVLAALYALTTCRREDRLWQNPPRWMIVAGAASAALFCIARNLPI